MSPLEIDKALALAIGYLPEHVKAGKNSVMVYREYASSNTAFSWGTWLLFSHADPTVIWPLAKHYKCFPSDSAIDHGRWWARSYEKNVYADTPEAAVAMAIIRGVK